MVRSSLSSETTTLTRGGPVETSLDGAAASVSTPEGYRFVRITTARRTKPAGGQVGLVILRRHARPRARPLACDGGRRGNPRLCHLRVRLRLGLPAASQRRGRDSVGGLEPV